VPAARGDDNQRVSALLHSIDQPKSEVSGLLRTKRGAKDRSHDCAEHKVQAGVRELESRVRNRDQQAHGREAQRDAYECTEKASDHAGAIDSAADRAFATGHDNISQWIVGVHIRADAGALCDGYSALFFLRPKVKRVRAYAESQERSYSSVEPLIAAINAANSVFAQGGLRCVTRISLYEFGQILDLQRSERVTAPRALSG
jgi:hypothetical protein